jgi:hypothetical protein
LALGVTQIILWGGSFFLIAVLADPIVQSTGWPQSGSMSPFRRRLQQHV